MLSEGQGMNQFGHNTRIWGSSTSSNDIPRKMGFELPIANKNEKSKGIAGSSQTWNFKSTEADQRTP